MAEQQQEKPQKTKAPTLKEKIAALDVSRPLKAVLQELAEGQRQKERGVGATHESPKIAP